MKYFNNIVIQGLGFVGAAMAVAIASRLNEKNNPIFNVTGIDLEKGEGQKRIDAINAGKFPFKTKDTKLNDELSKAVLRGNLKATSRKKTYSEADIIIVSINCDLLKKKGSYGIDFDQFTKSIKEIADNISEDSMVIIESTVPPGTSEKIVYPIFEEKFDARGIDIKKFSLAHSYERVMPGENYMDSIINFWRVFAGINQLSADHCEAFLSQIINIKKFPLTRLKTMRASETAKLLENSYRAVNIAFIEEWGRFAEEVGVDLYEVIEAIRVRPTHSNIRQPGFGVGGYCLTKDPLFAKIAAKDIFHLKGHDFPFSTNAIAVNQRMPLVTLEKLKQYFGGTLSNKKLLLLGVSYRQDIDDTRFSPSEIFVNEAEKIGAIITAYDPFVEYWTEMDIQLPSELPDLLQYDAIVFAVPHNEFQNLSFKDLQPDHDLLIFDANNVLSKVQIKNILDNRIRFLSIGRG